MNSPVICLPGKEHGSGEDSIGIAFTKGINSYLETFVRQPLVMI
jgi:hypothetical protein